jgi:hypothetical protein
MNASGLLRSVRFVVGRNGRPTAVQMDMEAWSALLDWLEEHEDRALVRATIAQLRDGPQKAGALPWEDVRGEWDASVPEPRP